jgi:hypothetical protein
MAKAKPKTGERRETNQPLKIDRLPSSVHDDILFLRNVRGKTWQEIEALSAEPVKKEDGSKGSGFIDWPALDFKVLELFPDMRLPHSSLHRWYDLRVDQVRKEVLVRSQQAHKIAEAFAKSTMAGGDEAVINAARDTIMGILAEDGTAKGRVLASKGLLALAEVMQISRANDIKERKVAADQRKLKLVEAREARAIQKLDQETEKLSKKATRGEITVEDINRIRERTFGLPPVKKVV